MTTIDTSPEEIARLLDHSLLNPALDEHALADGCVLARDLGCATVCIVPYFVARAAEILAGSGCLTSTTVGFPHGCHAPATKVAEARTALDQGAAELDMVVNISQVKSHDWVKVRDDIRGVLDVTRQARAKLKVIFENCYLTQEEKIRLCELCAELEVDWAKTSTGFGPSGATEDDLRLMRRHLPESVELKASGGIRTLDAVLRMRELGATRVGTSVAQVILAEARAARGL